MYGKTTNFILQDGAVRGGTKQGRGISGRHISERDYLLDGIGLKWVGIFFILSFPPFAPWVFQRCEMKSVALLTHLLFSTPAIIRAVFFLVSKFSIVYIICVKKTKMTKHPNLCMKNLDS